MANISSADDTTLPPTVQVASATASLLPRVLVSFALITSWSPGRTGRRNFTLSTLMRNGVLPSLEPRRSSSTPEACAIASICSTPGINGSPG
jgi:hypothetical protein